MTGPNFMQLSSSTLFVVATPIGNLADISKRAIDVLGKVDYIYAEDTRHSGRLLQHYGVRAALASLHEHNEQERLQQIESQLQGGANIALISDAGTPLISDPGYRLVLHCHAKGYRVSPVPGPSALVAALCVSGLPTDSFVFCGFPPSRATSRVRWFTQFANDQRTHIFYESRHRIVASLNDMSCCFGEQRNVTVARELTKSYETVRYGTFLEICHWIENSGEQQKGEFVIVVAGMDSKVVQNDEHELERVLRILLVNLPVSQAASIAAEIVGCKRKRAYSLALQIREE